MPLEGQATAAEPDIREELKRIRKLRDERLHELQVAQAASKGEPPEEMRELVDTQEEFHQSVQSALQAAIGGRPETSEHQHA